MYRYHCCVAEPTESVTCVAGKFAVGLNPSHHLRSGCSVYFLERAVNNTYNNGCHIDYAYGYLSHLSSLCGKSVAKSLNLDFPSYKGAKELPRAMLYLLII